MNNDIHIGLQGKGGVGKSWQASLLAQVLAAMDTKLLAIDTDPVNQTLSRYESLPVRSLEILTAHKQINTRAFDQMVDWMIEHDGPVVVDNGATSFVPATGYLVENDTIGLLAAHKRRVILHCVITGGQALDDTIIGLRTLLKNTAAPIVVWLNEFHGPIQKDGKTFIESETYSEYQGRILGIVTLTQRNAETFGRDISDMTSRFQTFAEALADPTLGHAQKNRLRQTWDDIAGQLIPLLNGGTAEAAA